MSKPNLFQLPIQPNSESGLLPQMDGLVSYTQNKKTLGGGQFVVFDPLFIRDGYYFLLLQFFDTFQGNGNVFLRAYPKGVTNFPFFVNLSPDGGLDLSFVTSPMPIGSGFQLVGAIFGGNAGVDAFFTYYGIHLKDCAENRKDLGIR